MHCCTGYGLFFFFLIDPWIHNLYWVLCSWTCFIPWCISCLLMVNRSMIPKVVTNLDTVIKTLSTVFLFVNGAIWFDNEHRNCVSTPLRMSCYISLLLVAVLFMLMISSIDGLNHDHWQKRHRVCFIGFMAMYFLFLLCLVQVTFHDYRMTLPLIEQSISIKSNMLSGLKILFIFLSKQAINTLRSKHECVCITVSPHLEWMQ